MKKTIFLLILISFSHCLLSAQDSFSSSHKKGVFTTIGKVKINAAFQSANSSVDKFLTEYHTNFNALFTWAFKGLKLKGEKDDFTIYNIKAHISANSVAKGKMDMNITLINKNYPDVNYTVELKKTHNSSDKITILYHMTQCDHVIKTVTANVEVVRESDKVSWIILKADVELTRFYDTFMTQKQYNENIESRMKKFIENLRDEAEK